MNNVIDTDDYAASGIEVFTFPGGEPHANVPKWGRPNVHIFAKIRTWNDMGYLLVVMDALRTQGVRINLFAPYLPGARQDRNPDGLTPLTAELYANLLSEYANIITAVDVHSQTAREFYLSSQLKLIGPMVFLKDMITDVPACVIAPDKGAVDRASIASQILGCFCTNATKTREFGTGKLTGFVAPDFSNGPIGKDDRLLIVDDICDGGGTFVGLLEELRKTHDGPVDLLVTHGIFSKGLGVLNGFDKIYTTDSWYRGVSNRVRSLPLLPYYIGGLNP